MSSPPKSFKLNNGIEIPSVALGTWQSKPGQVETAVEHALKSGYRHIDCARIYQNEAEVGKGIAASGIPRNEIFVTTKVWVTYQRRVEECLDESLKLLGLDYVDALLIHWPVALNEKGNHQFFPKREDGSRDVDTTWDPCVDSWKLMEQVLKTGKTKSIGVSNWSVPKLKKLLEHSTVTPALNQVELHPYLPQIELLEFCRSKGIQLEAYSPLGSTESPLLSDGEIQKIADKHNVSTGTVLISYQVNRGVVVLPKSVTPSRIESNLEVIKLDDQDMETLNGLHKTKGKRLIAPDWGVDLEWN